MDEQTPLTNLEKEFYGLLISDTPTRLEKIAVERASKACAALCVEKLKEANSDIESLKEENNNLITGQEQQALDLVKLLDLNSSLSENLRLANEVNKALENIRLSVRLEPTLNGSFLKYIDRELILKSCIEYDNLKSVDEHEGKE